MHSTDSDYIGTYDQAILSLASDPLDRAAQHRAVLALARAGSLTFALSEYKRYGLDRLRNQEDIMALWGRLLKDLYLCSEGQTALEYARASSEKYEAAYNDTKGYYSAINSAAMGFMANMPSEIIEDRCRHILDNLIASEFSNKEDQYYIEATRAEAFFILGELKASQKALCAAIAHDPLNYTAHASTLKQFKMLGAKMGVPEIWTAEFKPPKVVHFAGHLFGCQSDAPAKLNALLPSQCEAFGQQMSDHIQRHDIGFGYGALAAGADIIMAESLLSEGAELHIILPCAVSIFKKYSVLTFGQNWGERFDMCLKAAQSVNIVSNTDGWPHMALNRHASQIAMGEAILKARSLSTEVAQIVFWDGDEKGAGTALHFKDWASKNREQILLQYPGTRKVAKTWTDQQLGSQVKLLLSVDGKLEKLPPKATASIAAKYALALQTQKPSAKIGLHIAPELEDDNINAAAIELSNLAVPGSILVSESFAAILAYDDQNGFRTAYMGMSGSPTGGQRIFALSQSQLK